MKSKTPLYILSVIFPIIILVSMSFVPMMTYLFGEEIRLETAPVDPRDLFRGDYVRLNFKINEVPLSAFPDHFKSDLKDRSGYGELDMYAVLKKEGNYYTVDEMSFRKPRNAYYLWAKVNKYQYLQGPNNLVRVEYPIDRFFVPEGTGTDLEELSREGKLHARIKVWNGYPLLLEVE